MVAQSPLATWSHVETFKFASGQVKLWYIEYKERDFLGDIFENSFCKYIIFEEKFLNFK